ncbi:ribosome small subunit-dependent GTPase A [Mammaliicoccus stepanovicii]|uniref:Small ribosomal subunit biogenesis GTPase RsgA n=1 Tax=Mammaliicoccus stepanovicii TaxID=643214 RepID=A0A239YPH2_9STAP|nr:ribosome small subunit-dependent GTPase A [Mammaliicoccus stepanovicii]PNZ74785.1 ribosome small subunit-dependent GTPase A [Mammaliicoccus stepanovicii]GGI42437.1 ribosome small subunit-dependent GTPase [Mammaliicoccus stepanovicii]SNV61111.1 ribosome small subunit-dependent GTPase A [Mammaliicoccus stepanovicii]
MNLNQLGLKIEQNAYFNTHYNKFFKLGRISFVAKNHFKIIMNDSDEKAEITQTLVNNDMIPAIGDWVVINQMDNFNLIVDILPRISELKRQSKKHETLTQYIATNLDEVFVVMGLDSDFNLNRLERYIIQINESRAMPIIILNKLDAVSNYKEKVSLVRERMLNVPIIVTSVLKNINLDLIQRRFYEGMTAALVGSSGVGKSSIANYLIGKEVLAVNEVRDDDSKGRHTTTYRGLYLVNPKGVIIDTPGMRSLSLFADSSDLNQSFEDILALAKSCKFNDCTHMNEPGCAVQDAISSRQLDKERFQNFLKLQKEIAFIQSKSSKKAISEKKKEWKKRTKSNRNRHKNKY